MYKATILSFLFISIFYNQSKAQEKPGYFMHPDLHDMIEYCLRNDVRVGVSTNVTLLTAKTTDLILKNPPDILLLSLDGATKETVERIRVGSKFEKTMEKVFSVIAPDPPDPPETDESDQ